MRKAEGSWVMISARQTSHGLKEATKRDSKRHNFFFLNKHKIHSCILDSRPGGKGKKKKKDPEINSTDSEFELTVKTAAPRQGWPGPPGAECS